MKELAKIAAIRGEERAKKEGAANYKAQVYKSASSTTCPVDEYKGADKVALKAKIKQAWEADKKCCNQCKILKIYITGEKWERSKGYDGSNSTNTYRYYDESLLSVEVVWQATNAEFKEEIATIASYSLIKDNTDGGSVMYTDDHCNKMNAGKMLIANIK
ncbi:MAG: hypothetical protein IAF38_14500 [Bacteroidia bacterium]|nr:hypothetical protein [Bacteroidia bacterium]